MLFVSNCLCLSLYLLMSINYRWCCCSILVHPIGVEANAWPDFSPSSYSYRYRRDGLPNNNEVDLGTTLVAIKYSQGVIVAADTRTSVGGYVSNKFAYKINPIFELEEWKSNGGSDLTVSSSSSSSCVLCR